MRDYAKWFTVFGTIKPLFHNDIPVAILYLSGLNLDFLHAEYKNLLIDPIPEFIVIDSINFEKISMTHYFPPPRSDDKAMDNYAKKIGSAKPFYDYYSRQIFKQTVHLDNNINFDFIIHSEGYETKRMYDTLLSRRAKSPIDKILQHTDAERYGLWACKGGVPIERIDDWIEGGRGVGTYTYMHAFVDCDSFDLTANRSSIGNTNLEIQTKIKAKINEIFSIKFIQTSLQEREDWELQTKTQRKIDEDESELKKRYEQTKKRKNIIFPDGTKFPEPSLLKTGYSESETFLLLVRLLDKYPSLFKFQLLDYNTTDGIDFVVEEKAFPKYIELKGTFSKKINHSFRNISKFICYDSSLAEGDTVEDVEEFVVKLQANKTDKFESFIPEFHNKPFTSFMLIPSSTSIQSMPVIMLKKLLIELIGAKVE